MQITLLTPHEPVTIRAKPTKSVSGSVRVHAFAIASMGFAHLAQLAGLILFRFFFLLGLFLCFCRHQQIIHVRLAIRILDENNRLECKAAID